MAVRGYDEAFQQEVEEYRNNPDKGTRNQTTSRDRHDLAEKQETRKDSNNG
ncbi:hypothetical protein D478_24133 [Brevibacillus agri BAB-2500]|nr:hypothetical protein D478_24133 [Brevibacillus agri BAB-2500]